MGIPDLSRALTIPSVASFDTGTVPWGTQLGHVSASTRESSAARKGKEASCGTVRGMESGDYGAIIPVRHRGPTVRNARWGGTMGEILGQPIATHDHCR